MQSRANFLHDNAIHCGKKTHNKERRASEELIQSARKCLLSQLLAYVLERLAQLGQLVQRLLNDIRCPLIDFVVLVVASSQSAFDDLNYQNQAPQTTNKSCVRPHNHTTHLLDNGSHFLDDEGGLQEPKSINVEKENFVGWANQTKGEYLFGSL